jgi:hypothetical protein
MTRINVGVQPSELVGKHLIAEHREIKRIPNAIKSGRFNMKGIPKEFTLGTGHVKFFYNKILYLKKRYELIYQECRNRGYNVSNFIESFNDIPKEYMGNYTPTQKDRDLIIERINSKLNKTRG